MATGRCPNCGRRLKIDDPKQRPVFRCPACEHICGILGEVSLPKTAPLPSEPVGLRTRIGFAAMVVVAAAVLAGAAFSIYYSYRSLRNWRPPGRAEAEPARPTGGSIPGDSPTAPTAPPKPEPRAPPQPAAAEKPAAETGVMSLQDLLDLLGEAEGGAAPQPTRLPGETSPVVVRTVDSLR